MRNLIVWVMEFREVMLFVIGLIGVIRNSSFPQPARMEWDKYGKVIVFFFCVSLVSCLDLS